MTVRAAGRVTWTCDACGRGATADLSVAHEGFAWPVVPPGWSRHMRDGEYVMHACSDACRAAVAPRATAWSALRYEEVDG